MNPITLVLNSFGNVAQGFAELTLTTLDPSFRQFAVIKKLVDEDKSQEAIQYMQAVSIESDYYRRNPKTALYLGMAYMNEEEWSKAKLLIQVALTCGQFNVTTAAQLVQLLDVIDEALSNE